MRFRIELQQARDGIRIIEIGEALTEVAGFGLYAFSVLKVIIVT